MPDYAASFVRITGKDKKKLITFMDSEESLFDFNRILPVPEALPDSDSER